MKKSLIVVALGCAAISGCTQESMFDERIVRAENLLENIGSSVATPVDAMPTIGSAQYSGVSIVEFAAGDVLLGDANVNVNFGTNSVTGTLGDFVDDADEKVNGTLGISAGIVTGNELAFKTTGILDVSRGSSALDVAIDVDHEGAFSGASAQHIVTGGVGTADYSDSSVDDVAILVVGESK